MSTRSYIGIYDSDGATYKYVYCHFNGFPEHQLPILRNSYNTKEKVEALIVKGGFRALCDNINNIEFYGEDCDSAGEIDIVETPIQSFIESQLMISYMYVFNTQTNEWSIL